MINNNILLPNSGVLIAAIIGWLAFGAVLIHLIIVTIVMCYHARKTNTNSSRSTDSDREVQLVSLII